MSLYSISPTSSTCHDIKADGAHKLTIFIWFQLRTASNPTGSHLSTLGSPYWSKFFGVLCFEILLDMCRSGKLFQIHLVWFCITCAF